MAHMLMQRALWQSRPQSSPGLAGQGILRAVRLHLLIEGIHMRRSELRARRDAQRVSTIARLHTSSCKMHGLDHMHASTRPQHLTISMFAAET